MGTEVPPPSPATQDRRTYLGTTIKTAAFAGNPFLSTATAPMVCVPLLTFFFCHVAAQEVTFVHIAMGLPSPVTVIDAMPLGEFAETAILTLPFTVDPLVGALTATLGGEADVVTGVSVVTDTLDDCDDVLPATS